MEAPDTPMDGETTGTEPEAGSGIDPQILQRLDELQQGVQSVQEYGPVLQNLNQALAEPEYEDEPEPDGYYDDETGMVDVDGFREAIQKETLDRFQQELSPLQQEIQELRAERELENFSKLKEKYPELQQPDVEREMVEMATKFTQRYNVPLDTELVRTLYLARSAEKQAQQGVPAGGQEVALEGGSAQPGQPEVDPTQERFMNWAQQGSAGSPFGRPIQDLL